jgi:hypothetical protein
MALTDLRLPVMAKAGVFMKRFLSGGEDLASAMR